MRWSKVIQFRERLLHIPLPEIPNSPFCPSTALLHLMLENPVGSFPVPLLRYSFAGATHVPLTYKQLMDKLRFCLAAIGYKGTGVVMHTKDICTHPLSCVNKWRANWGAVHLVFSLNHLQLQGYWYKSLSFVRSTYPSSAGFWVFNIHVHTKTAPKRVIYIHF